MVRLPPGATKNECPFCETNDWVLTRSFLGFRILPIARGQPLYARIAALTCQTCGFVRFQHPDSFDWQPKPEGGRADRGTFPTEKSGEEPT